VAGDAGLWSPFVAGGARPLSLFMVGGAGPSSPFAHGGTGPSFAVHGAGCSLSLLGGAGHSSSIVGGVAGPLLFFMGGGAGRWSHCSWVVVVCPHHAVCEWWWWCALVSFCVAWPLSLSWWSCHRLRERVVGCSCLQMLHPSSSHVGVLCRFHVLSLCVLVVVCPRHCCMSLIIIVCPCHVVVPCPPLWRVI